MRTVLIGQGAIALRCLEMLTQQTLKPVLIVSFDSSLSGMAKRLGVPHLSERRAVSTWFEHDDCDFLFSVRNPWIIPAAVLERVRRRAVNFHDSLLPRYAGLHATSWALLNGETEHGITWHEISSTIDTGCVLKQVRIPIEPSDTAFTLNTKCFDRAVIAFGELLTELRENRLQPFPQAGERSYFGGRARPEAACTLDFDRPAACLVDLTRALDFGAAPNPLALPKIWVGKQPLAVRSVRRLPKTSGSPPGTLLEVSDCELIVATRTEDVALSGFRGLSNDERSVDELLRLAKISPGDVLPALTPAQRQALTELDTRVCPSEAAWLDLLHTPVPAFHPYALIDSTQPAICFPLDQFSRTILAVAEPARKARARALILAYLGRLTRDDAFDVGVIPPADEDLADGYFAAIAPWRISIRRDETFAEFDRRVTRSFQDLERAPTYALDLPARWHDRAAGGSISKWPIALLEAPTADAAFKQAAGLAFWLDANARIHLVAPGDQPLWQVEALDRQLATLAEAVATNPSRPVLGLPWIDAQERERIFVAFNATHRPLPEECVHHLIEEQARRSPDALAVRFGTTELSYVELVREARRLANVLAARGVRRGERVILCVERSAQIVVGMLGILEAGAAYVPVDPAYPSARVTAIVAQSGARCAVTRSHLCHTLLTDLPSTVCFDRDADELLAATVTPPAVQTDPDDLAYVIFTSGSTGAPKGVEIRHRSLVNHSLAIGENYGLAPGDRMLCSASIGFDVTGEQIYPALFRGAAVVVRPENLLESFTRFEAFAREENITAMILPTAFWHEWVRELRLAKRQTPRTLRVLSVGTEKAQGEHLAAFQALSGGRVRFFQGYGPTETTVTCTMYIHDGTALDPHLPLPIGRPLPNTEIYVLDQAMQPVPIGIEGEVYVGGIGLARGYASRPDLTRERFIEHPFDPTPGARLYKTGDLGRFQPDGQLVYIGRNDFQVKVNGYRVELGEIESVIRSARGVDECLVMLREDIPGTARLVAYVVPNDMALDPSSLEDLCATKLPPYMVPSAIVRLDGFPLTQNFKVDRRALPAPAARQTSHEFIPRDDVELVIAKAFGEALGISDFGPHDSFFNLGGNSLGAVLVLERIRATCSTELSLAEFFGAPNVAALADLMRRGGGVNAPTLIELKAGQGGPPLFLVCGIQIYADLARALDTPGPVYAVLLPQEWEVARHGGDLPAVEVLAAQYLKVIRKQFPRGPYALGGISFGGAVAYEMAQQLRAVGVDVPVLALLDTNLPRGQLRGFGHRLKRWARSAKTKPWGSIKQIVARLSRRSGSAPEAEAHLDFLRLEAFRRALLAYENVVRPYPGAAVLFRAFEADTDRRFAPDRGWAKLVRGGLTFHDFAASHLAILRQPVVGALARALSDHLNAVPTPDAASPVSTSDAPLRMGTSSDVRMQTDCV